MNIQNNCECVVRERHITSCYIEGAIEFIPVLLLYCEEQKENIIVGATQETYFECKAGYKYIFEFIEATGTLFVKMVKPNTVDNVIPSENYGVHATHCCVAHKPKLQPKDKKKVIKTVITNCYECPFEDHTGAFTEGGAQPCCSHEQVIATKGTNCFKRIIPFKRVGDNKSRVLIPKEIPDWCPL